MAATVWVVFVGLQRGVTARYADENGRPTTDIRKARKFDAPGPAKAFIRRYNLGETSRAEQVTISDSDML